jgi:predicted transcriptional regulator
MLSAAGSDGVPRRARGALEAAIMDVLWRADGPLSPGEVRDLLATSADAAARALSYSTVVTILTRLHGKKMLIRTRVGRSFQYAPLADEAGLEARRLSALLDGSADRAAVLSRFVADLSDSDEELLRRLLGPTQSADDARR